MFKKLRRTIIFHLDRKMFWFGDSSRKAVRLLLLLQLFPQSHSRSFICRRHSTSAGGWNIHSICPKIHSERMGKYILYLSNHLLNIFSNALNLSNQNFATTRQNDFQIHFVFVKPFFNLFFHKQNSVQ